MVFSAGISYEIFFTFKGSTMSLKKVLFLITTLSVLSGKSFASFEPQLLKPDGDEKKEIESQKNNLVVDQIFTQGGINYTIYKDLKAYVGKETKQKMNKSSTNGLVTENSNVSQEISLENGKKVLLDKGLFKIYDDSNNFYENSQLSKLELLSFKELSRSEILKNEEVKYGYKIAYNEQSKKFGVITGNAILKIDPAKEVKLPNRSFRIVKSYKQLGLYVVILPKNIQFKDAIDNLKNLNPDSKGVIEEQNSSVNVEVLENFKSTM